ncbi:hypothetical protein MKX01_011730 [Papaver californicum]|nr:hypothetical protein MKX01_011730 [Papaver californicum]
MSGRKETVLDLAKFVDKGVQVKLTGGRQSETLFASIVDSVKRHSQWMVLLRDPTLNLLQKLTRHFIYDCPTLETESLGTSPSWNSMRSCSGHTMVLLKYRYLGR